MTHMPFLAKDRNGARVLIFCRGISEGADSPRWKLWYELEPGRTRRLETGLSDGAVECSPTAWHDDAGWHVTFIAGMALYRMDGRALDQLSKPELVYRPACAGFVFKGRLVHAALDYNIHVLQLSGNVHLEVRGAIIYRVAYRSDDPEKLLISGRFNSQADVFTIEYDLESGEQAILECDGRPAYKCTILGHEVLYAERIGDHFEKRRITSAQALKRIPLTDAVRRL